ncbi:hypothetical protein [Alicyclobacillus suci]|uniref:hypothetical protein n=1 Tax=Alicyclobacillus suci TaxID=2816080 RepID=UPI001A8DD1F7|nr:hypothetical protein [Alicyclobacillus suci]
MNKEKVMKIAHFSYVGIFTAMFGYTLLPKLPYLWLAIALVGGVLLAVKNNFLKTAHSRNKIRMLDIVIVLGLIVMIFLAPMPAIIKEVIILIVAFFYYVYCYKIMLKELSDE